MNNGRAFPSAFGNKNNNAPRTNSSMWKNKQKEEDNTKRLEEARKTEFNDINFPSLAGNGAIDGWGGEEKRESVQSGNKWVELASDWKIHDIVEKQYAEIKKEEDERKRSDFTRILPKVFVENRSLGTTHSKHEDTYEEDPYYDHDTNEEYSNTDEVGWTTVCAKPKKVKKVKTRIEVPAGPSDDNGASIWENGDDEYEHFKEKSRDSY